MDQAYPTTPFGRRTMTLASVATQALARATPADKAAHKWKVLGWAREARDALGISDRSLSILHALLSFLPDTIMTTGPDLTVFASNEQLSARAHGMSESTLRRHLQALVVAGLIIRRDSPNGKRFARRGRGGEIEQAFGFDLTPLVARMEELELLAEEVERRRRVSALARERITILRRDLSKMISIGMASDVAGDWPGLHRELAALSWRLPRTVPDDLLTCLAADLTELAVRAGKLLESHVEANDTTGSATQVDAQHQRSKPDSIIELEPPSEKDGGEGSAKTRPSRAPCRFPLRMILEACPDFAFYARRGVSEWSDLLATAETVRGALGISASAWDEARAAMGDVDAAITIAGILQRSEEIKSPGGYLRSLTEKSRAGRYSTGPMVMSLTQRHLKSPRSQATAGSVP